MKKEPEGAIYDHGDGSATLLGSIMLGDADVATGFGVDIQDINGLPAMALSMTSCPVGGGKETIHVFMVTPDIFYVLMRAIVSATSRPLGLIYLLQAKRAIQEAVNGQL